MSLLFVLRIENIKTQAHAISGEIVKEETTRDIRSLGCRPEWLINFRGRIANMIVSREMLLRESSTCNE